MPNVHVRTHDWTNKDMSMGYAMAGFKSDIVTPAKAVRCGTCDMRNYFTNAFA